MGKRPRLVLGTVQLGMPYGIANSTGLPSEPAAIGLVRRAVDAGIGAIDTARAYGVSEQRLGQALRDRGDVDVTTKLDPLSGLATDATPRTAVAAARASLDASRTALARSRLDAVLLHRAAHRQMWDGAVWRVLRDEQASGAIRRIGISVQTPDEALAAFAAPEVGQVQLPFNLVDHRWHEAGIPAAARKRADVVVHVRSVFLQGLLTGATTARWPAIAEVDKAALMEVLGEGARRFGRTGLADLALAYVRSQDWIDGIVIGMETTGQLSDNLALWARTPLEESDCGQLRERLARLPDRFLDPAQWPAPNLPNREDAR